MLFVEGQCPHCNEKRGVKLFYVGDYAAQRPVKDLKAIAQQHPRGREKGLPARFHAGGTCPLCNEAILLGLEIEDAYLLSMRECITNHDKVYTGPAPKVLCMYPQPVPPYSHPSLPEKVRQLFVDMQTMLQQNLAPSLILTGCRSVLEEAARELGGTGKTLHKRIEDLKSKAVVNGVLADWAMHIKSIGNDAVHELSGTREEADELVEFTKLFLQYTFEFPDRVKALRPGTASPANA